MIKTLLSCLHVTLFPFLKWYKNTLANISFFKYKLSFRKYLFIIFLPSLPPLPLLSPVSVSDLSAVVEVVVEFDLQVDLFDLGLAVGLLVAVEDVDVPHGAVFGAEVLLHTLVHAHLHLGVERILLVHFLSLFVLPLGRPPAAAEQEARGQQGQDQQGHSGHSPAHRAAHVGVKGGGGPGLQTERLHVGAVLHLVALVIVDQRFVQRQPPAAVHQVAFGAAQLIGHRALNPGAGPRLWADHINDLQVPLVPRLHLLISHQWGKKEQHDKL